MDAARKRTLRLAGNQAVNALLAVAGTAAAVLVTRVILRERNSRGRANWAGKTVVITGGSRGLGLELVREWSSRGARVAFCARTAADVQRAADELRGEGCDVLGLVCDVTSRDDVDRFISAVAERWQQVDVLVNNAGVIQTGPIESMTLEDFRNSIDTHFWGPVYTTRAALPFLRREHGRIVNIASIGGKISVPHMLPYSAGKFALVGFSEGLRAELAKHGVRVTTVCPGLMRTGSPRNARFKGKHKAEYAWFNISDSLPLVSINSRSAARKIVDAAAVGQAFLSFTPLAHIAIRAHGLMPGVTSRVLSLLNYLLPRAGGIGKSSKLGKNSFSAWSPSIRTGLTEAAAAKNNEIR
jgi:NAD(P)-dependent dehydrogenase (short-subunit alcohol dehydrogenase family)